MKNYVDFVQIKTKIQTHTPSHLAAFIICLYLVECYNKENNNNNNTLLISTQSQKL